MLPATRPKALSRFGVERRNASSPTPRSRFSVRPLSRWKVTARCPGSASAAIKLLLLTGARRGEILALRWDEVDTERGCLRLQNSKTGAKVIRLAVAALSLLTALPRSSPWVFPAAKGSGHYVGLPKHWDAVRGRANAIALRRAQREGRSLKGVPSFDGIRLHDLRHSFASFAVQSGGSLFLVGKVLGHKQSRTTEIYAHARDEPLLATAELAAQRIARALAGSKKADRRRPPAASLAVTQSPIGLRRGRSVPRTKTL